MPQTAEWDTAEWGEADWPSPEDSESSEDPDETPLQKLGTKAANREG